MKKNNYSKAPICPQSDERRGYLWGGDQQSRCLSAETETDRKKLIRMAEILTAAVEISEDTPKAEILVPRLVENPNLPFEYAYHLAGCYYGVDDLGGELSSRPDATTEALDELLHDDCGRWVAEAVAEHPNASLSTLQRLLTFDDDYTDAIAKALANPKVSPSIIESWAHDPAPEVRSAVARGVSNPAMLKALAADEDKNVRIEAVRNPLTPAETVNHVASTDPDRSVVAAAAERVTDYKVLTTLAESLTDDRQELAVAILQNPHSADYAKTIAVLICDHFPPHRP